MRLRACLTAAVLSVASSSAFAQLAAPAYGVAFRDFYQIDLAARRASFVGEAGAVNGQAVAQVRGLTYGPGGEILAVVGNQKIVVQLDPASGTASYRGSLSGMATEEALDLSMTYACDGNLWIASANGSLWKTPPSAIHPVYVGNTGKPITGLAARGDTLYAAAGRDDNSLYRVDTTDATVERIGGFGTVPNYVNVVAMSFGADGTLWATLNYNPPALVDWSDLVKIDPASGALTVLGSLEGPSRLRGISMNGFLVAPTDCTTGGGPPEPVPAPVRSPWALALMMAGLALVAAFALRRRRTF